MNQVIPSLPHRTDSFKHKGHYKNITDWPRLNISARRILIVDAEPLILNILAKMAQKLGYHTTTATTAMDALQVLGKTFHDVVMIDYDLPRILGFQLATQIRSKHPGTWVIIMTNRCEAEITNQTGCLEIADGLLLKPFNLESMGKKIENIINSDLRKYNGQEFYRPCEKKL